MEASVAPVLAQSELSPRLLGLVVLLLSLWPFLLALSQRLDVMWGGTGPSKNPSRLFLPCPVQKASAV